MPSTSPPPESAAPEYKEALADIWIEDDQYKIGGISIVRKCVPEDDYLGECELTIKSNGRNVQRFSVPHARKYWLKYGVMNLLGKGDQQLIVFRYSGGAHCCYDYSIYDLTPFRSIYATPVDSANVIGNELVPVDIDGDGVQEFYQHVMAFDYMGASGHASASFPPAIFAYDRNKYTIANKRFPDFVMARLDYLTDLARAEKPADEDAIDEYLVRTRFLFLVYAGKRDEAWKYFEENYRSRRGNGYQEQFKNQFRKEFQEAFEKDPTYLSIYGK